jgi:uncharacterized protein YybS (DUF2232 family)
MIYREIGTKVSFLKKKKNWNFEFFFRFWTLNFFYYFLKILKFYIIPCKRK